MTAEHLDPIIAVIRITAADPRGESPASSPAIARPLICAFAVCLALLAASCSSSPAAPSSTPATAAPVAHWTLSGTVSSSAGGPITAGTVSVQDGPDANRTATTDASGRFTLNGLAQGGFTIRVVARGYTDATMGITLTANLDVDVRLLLPLARLLDIGGSDIRYDRLPAGGFDMFATAVNEGPGCANSVSGVTTIRNTAPPNLTLDFSWSLPATRTIQPGERFDYRVDL